ncbi:hypothetical protein E2C01_066497 [Portunus trituberculatus]|uniref:Uncharacterized protein n=1 Tax=Portunus trituberculatus TaxID=210409 RepID=A0A5B7HIB6_PORTR|nr:hypothetical protein [Portunus trituberculatus]
MNPYPAFTLYHLTAAFAAAWDVNPELLAVTRREGGHVGSSGSRVLLPLDDDEERLTASLIRRLRRGSASQQRSAMRR